MRIKKRFKRWLAKVLQNELSMYVPVGEVRIIQERPKSTIYRDVKVVDFNYYKGNENRIIEDIVKEFSNKVFKEAVETKVEPIEPYHNHHIKDGVRVISTIEILNKFNN